MMTTSINALCGRAFLAWRPEVAATYWIGPGLVENLPPDGWHQTAASPSIDADLLSSECCSPDDVTASKRPAW
jgi:hypothetical protein